MGRPTAHASGSRFARPPAALQTTTDDSEQNNTGPLGGPVTTHPEATYVTEMATNLHAIIHCYPGVHIPEFLDLPLYRGFVGS